MKPRNAPRALAVVTSAFVALSLLIASAPAAFAQNAKVEATAKALQKKAMEEDYLATEFTKAQDKLDKAAAQCGTDKCSAGTRALIRRDLGVVQVGGQLDKEKGIGNFVEAIKLDANIALDPDLRTKDLDAAFAEAKKRAAGGGGGGTGGGTKPPPAASGDQPSGDFVHTPAAEQQVRTPIPVYVEYGGEEQLVKVIARYKGFGMTDWKTVELKKTGEKGWGGLLPCADVQQGTSQYYLQGFNTGNDVVASGGDRNNPYKVPVKTEKVASPPTLPGQPPPTQCQDTGDCPPNFPGCKKGAAAASTEPVGKDGGEFCEEDSECKSHSCVKEKCTDPEGAKTTPKFWIGFSGGFDYSLLGSANDVCKLQSLVAGAPNVSQPGVPLNDKNYYCVNADGSDYPTRAAAQENENLRLGISDKVSGGGAFGNIRILASLDYALNLNLLLGLRLGYVANTYPGSAAGEDGNKFPPLHLELRGTYLFGQDALAKKLAPFIMAGTGVSTFDANVQVSVVETVAGANRARVADAWQIAGPAFFMLGGGLRVALGQRAAFTGGLRVNFAFGNAFATSLGPELGFQFGF